MSLSRSTTILHGFALRAGDRLMLALVLLAITASHAQWASAQQLGSGEIEIVGVGLDVDTRPDLSGIQYTMSALRDVPSVVSTVVGTPGVDASSNLPTGTLVKASVAGPGFGSQVVTITTKPNEPFQLPIFRTAGDYTLYNVRLEDPQGNVILHRDASLPPVSIQVINEILVTQVTTRALTLDEIEELGIEIDEDNFQVLNFAFGLTLGSRTVPINLPVVVPLDFTSPEGARQALRVMEISAARLESYGIPNLSLAGFQMRAVPEEEITLPVLPPISGVIVIPGNIAYLNQFFSVFVQTSNLAPAGSGLSVLNARARIVLPTGGDQIPRSGDDPLRIATTQTGGQQSELPLLDEGGSNTLPPQGTNAAQFLVEGLRQGTHPVDFEISGDLTVPGRPTTYRLTGRAAGVVQVENPTFDIVLAHPRVVRDGEAYSIFATVTNTSDQPANLFTLRLKSNSLSGAHFAPGETETRSIRTLAARQSETMEFRLISEETGAVSGTVFMADDGITGSFVMTAGVGDTGIPLSPDTIVLPQEALELPREPNLVWSTVRLLGQAHSVATAPANALPPNIPRINGRFMRERGGWLGQVGTHIQFGDTVPRVVKEIVMDYFGNDLPRVTTIYASDPERDPTRSDRYAADIRAFDVLRRASDAGNDLTDVFAAALAPEVTLKTLPVVQREWAEDYASRPSHLSFGARSRGPPVRMTVTDGTGRVTGLQAGQTTVRRDVAFADYFQFPASQDRLLLVGTPDSPNYRFDAVAEAAGIIDFSLVVPRGAELVQVVFENVSVSAGSRVRLAWAGPAATQYQLDIDLNGDGSFESQRAGSAQVVEDRAPTIVRAQQWGKGQLPLLDVDQQSQYRIGDALGRLVGVLFDEEVSEAQAEALTNYAVTGNQVRRATLQPDRRLVFLNVTRPVGPFVAVSLHARNVVDQRSHAMVEVVTPIVMDPELGDGATLTGQVFTASGETVPYATIDYVQPVMVCGGFYCELKMLGVTKLTSDAAGRFNLDFVLQDGYGPFNLRAVDPQTGEGASINAEVQYDGQRMVMNLIQRGLATLEGDVFEEDGRRVTRQLGPGEQAGRVSNLLVRAMNLSTGEEWTSWVDENGHYSFPRRFVDVSGHVTDVPQLGVGNISLSLIRPSDGYVALQTINIPASGSEVRQDLVLRPPGQFGRVTVRVLEPDGVTPASSVFVEMAAQSFMSVDPSGERVFRDDLQRGVIAVKRTDDSGLVTFDNVPVGDILVQGGRKGTGQSARASSFLESAEHETVNLVLPGPGGTVRGVLRDALGNIVGNASIAVGPYLVTTDANGRFEVRNLPRGRLTVYGRGNDSPALATQQIETNGPDDLQEIVLTLEPIGTIEGVLYEADRVTVVPSQRVQLWVEPEAGAGESGLIAQTETDSAGHFIFARYPLRRYSIRAITPDQGDGGMGLTAIRFAGDHRNVQVYLRGRGSQVIGRVVQDNGTPAIADTVLIHKTWRISRLEDSRPPNPYLDFVRSLAGSGGEVGDAVTQMLSGPDFAFLDQEFFVLTDRIRTGRSDVLGPNGEVTGNFVFSGGIAPGPFKVGAISGFLAPAEATGAIPVTTDPAQRIVNVGDLVLQAATASVRGRVFMPDGVTPVGAGVRVIYKAQSDTGDTIGGIAGPVLPEYSVITDANGAYEFPLTLRGSYTIKADTGVAPVEIRARSPAEMRTDLFQDVNGNRILNVRLYGMAHGVAPLNGEGVTDVRLQDAGAVRVRVIADDAAATPVPQAEVTLTTETELDDEDEPEFERLLTDADGYLTLFPVTEGRVVLLAHRAGFPLDGRTNVEMPRDPANGHIVEATVTMGTVTSTAGVVTRVRFFGTVRGLVTDHAGAPVANPTRISIQPAGIELFATTGTDGRFVVEYVPGGVFTVEAFEPYTARTGTVTGALETSGQIVDVTIPLNGVGTVTGRVLSNDGQRPIVDADVTLRASGDFTREVTTRTDTNGTFTFPGVPTGTYQLQALDVATRLQGSASGNMPRNGELVTTDVYMQPSARIRGVVYAAGVQLNAAGQPVDANGNVIANAPTVANAEVFAKDRSAARVERQARTDAAGVYDLGDGLPLSEYSIRVAATDRVDGTHSRVVLTYDGQVVEHPLVLDGTGRIEGVVLDASGVPAAFVEVTLRSRSDFISGQRTRITPADGSFSFEGIPVGEFSLTLRTTTAQTPLGGGASDRLVAHGTVVSFRDDDTDDTRAALRIQPAGSLLGVVRRPDGSIAAGSAVTVRRGEGAGALVVSQIVDAAGAFRFDGMPLGQYAVSVLDEALNGVAGRSANLLSNEQQIDLGIIVVDATAPRVVSTVPAMDATGVHGAAPIRVTFSEPITPSSLNPDTLRVTIDGVVVEGSRTLSGDGLIATFEPTARMPDLKPVLVRVKGDRLGFEGEVLEHGIKDLEGIGLVGDHIVGFITGDTTPPNLVSMTPITGSVDVPLESVIRIELDEAIAPASVQSFELRDGAGNLVGGQFTAQPILGGRVFVFQPTVRLAPNMQYTARLRGPLTDLVGNAMPQAELVTAFGSLDSLPPELNGITLAGAAITGRAITLRADIGAQTDIRSVDFYVNGVLVESVQSAPFEFSLLLDARFGTSVAVGAVAEDHSGNRSSFVTRLVPIAGNQPPALSLSVVGSNTVLPGGALTVRAVASDDVGLGRINVLLGDGLASHTTIFSGETSVTRDIALLVPTNLAYGTTLVVRAAVEDSGAAVTLADELTVTVGDVTNPALSFGSPAAATRVNPGENMVVLIRADDISGVTRIELQASGALTFTGARDFTSANPAIATFNVPVPSGVSSLVPIVLTAAAIDAAGNRGERVLQVTAADRLGPAVSVGTASGSSLVGAGATVELRVAASDASGIASISLQSSHGIATQSRTLANPTQALEVFQIAIPAALAPDTLVDVFATATDTDGNSTSSVVLALRVADTTAPTVSVIEPASGGTVPSSQVMRVVVRASDAVALASVGVELSNAMTETRTVAIEEGTQQVEQVFEFDLPGTLVPGQQLRVAAFATDRSGNRADTGVTTVTITDGLPPAVDEIYPADGASNVPRDASLVIRFTEPVLQSSVAAGVVTLTHVAGSVNVAGTLSLSNDGLTVTFNPPLLQAGAAYAVRVQGLRDLIGNPMVGEFVSGFTAGSAVDTTRPTIVRTSVTGGATAVPLNARLSIEFSERMDPATLTPSNVFVRTTSTSTVVPAMLQLDAGGIRVTLAPQAALAPGVSYQLVINGQSIADLAGNTLTANSTLSFSTGTAPDVTAPRVDAISPPDGVNDVPINTALVVMFDEAIDPVSVAAINLSQAGALVPTSVALSEGNRRVQLSAEGNLLPSAAYLLSVGPGVRDLAGNQIAAAVAVQFQTGTATDNAAPTAVLWIPEGNATNVPRNIVVETTYNKRLSPVDLESWRLVDNTLNRDVPGVVSLSADGRTVRFAPLAPLEAGRQYQRIATARSLAGISVTNSLSFTTSTAVDAQPPQLVSAAIADGAQLTVTNPRVSLRFGEALDVRCVNGSSLRVLDAAGTPVPGTVSLSTDGRTLTFTPSQNLSAGAQYTVHVTGLCDIAGNIVPTSQSSFATTAGAIADTVRPSVVTTVPANSASGVAVTTTLAATFSEPIDATTVDAESFRVFGAGISSIAGSYSVSGNVVTFTPSLPLPGGQQINWQLTSSMRDLAGNTVISVSRNFTTAVVIDDVSPQVIAVSPADLSTGIGVTNPVVLTLSEPLESGTVNASSFALYSGGQKLSASVTRAQDGQSVVLTGAWPANALIQVVATPDAEDLAGNALLDFLSEFTTAGTPDATRPSIASMRPANGAAAVGRQQRIVFFATRPMDAATIPAALQVAQNGVLVQGAVSLRDNNRTIEFAPSQPWAASALVEVFLTSDARDLQGNSLNDFQSSFRVIPDSLTSEPELLAVSVGAAVNTVIEALFSEPLDPATITTSSVRLMQDGCFGTLVPATVTLEQANRVIRVLPSAPLVASGTYALCVSRDVRDLQGEQIATTVNHWFSIGNELDLRAPVVQSMSPGQGFTNVPTNARVSIVFDEPINPLSLNQASIQISTGSGAPLAADIAFGDGTRRLILTPHGPLAPATTYSVSASGITDAAGNSVMPASATFTTGSEPDTDRPVALSISPDYGETDVPINAVLVLQLDEPIDPASLPTQNVLYDSSFGIYVPMTFSVSADGRQVTLVGTGPLAVNHSYQVSQLGQIRDLAGNALSSSSHFFRTGGQADAQAPTVAVVSPSNGATAVPTNTPVVVRFSEPIRATTASGAVLMANGAPVSVDRVLADGNRLLTLVPRQLMAGSTVHSIELAQIRDLAGSLLLPVTSTFTSGTGADFTSPVLLSSVPASGASNVPRNIAIELAYNERLRPPALDSSALQLRDNTANRLVSGTVTLSADARTLRFTPDVQLEAGRQYQVNASVRDLVGNLRSNNIFFNTGVSADTQPPQVTSATLPEGVEIGITNPRIAVRFDEAIDARCFGPSSMSVSLAGVPVSGSAALSTDGRTASFVPSQPLSANGIYVVSLSGLCDAAGNTIPAYSSTFRTHALATVDLTAPAYNSTIIPANGATNVPVGTTIIVNTSERIDPTSVDANSFRVFTTGISSIAGTYFVGTNELRFTPAQPFPGGVRIDWQLTNQIRDLAGNAAPAISRNFTTAVTTDTAAPQVIAVSPADLSSNIGITNPVVVTLSEPLQSSTVNSTSFALYANGVRLSSTIARSDDGRVVTLTGEWPANSFVQLVATPVARDLAGNPLLDFLSEFQTASAVDTTAPSIASQRPASGAEVSSNVDLILVAREPLLVSSLQDALQIAEDGVRITGDISVFPDGRTIRFTPSRPWTPGALVEVVVTSAARDLSGNALSRYEGSFRVIPVLDAVPPIPIGYSITNSLNGLFEWLFIKPLDAATVTDVTVGIRPGGAFSGEPVVPATISLHRDGRLLRIVPNAPLAPNTYHEAFATVAVRDVNGIPLTSMIRQGFTTATFHDLSAPVLIESLPRDADTDVPTNGRVGLHFNEPLNPLSVYSGNAGTVVVRAAAGALVQLASVSFSDENRRVYLSPHAPLDAGATYTITIDGIRDPAGNALPSRVLTFQTAVNPDTEAGTLLEIDPASGAENIPVNTVIQLRLSEPVDPTSPHTVNVLYDTATGQYVAVTPSVSADGHVVSLVAPLAINRNYTLFGNSLQLRDRAGNYFSLSSSGFRTGSAVDSAAPQVLRVTPPSGSPGIPTNAKVVIEFNEPVRFNGISNVILQGPGGPVGLQRVLSNGNRTLTLTPQKLLTAGALHTLTVQGVADLAGNVIGAPVSTSFTTAVNADFSQPELMSTSPGANATSVVRNIVVEWVWNERLSPASINDTSVTLRDTSTNQLVAVNLSQSADGRTVTMTPQATLEPNRQYRAIATVLDLAGNGSTSSYLFTTGLQIGAQPDNHLWGFEAANFLGDDIGAMTFSSATMPTARPHSTGAGRMFPDPIPLGRSNRQAAFPSGQSRSIATLPTPLTGPFTIEAFVNLSAMPGNTGHVIAAVGNSAAPDSLQAYSWALQTRMDAGFLPRELVFAAVDQESSTLAFAAVRSGIVLDYGYDYFVAAGFDPSGTVTFWVRDLTRGGPMQKVIAPHTINLPPRLELVLGNDIRGEAGWGLFGLIDEVRLTRRLLSDREFLAANLIRDGGFERPILAPASFEAFAVDRTDLAWRVTPGAVDVFSQGVMGMTGALYDGVQGLDLVNAGSIDGGVEQTFFAVAGVTYRLRFAYSNNPLSTTTASASVSVRTTGGVELLSGSVTHNTATLNNLDWRVFEAQFIGAGSDVTLRLTNTQGGGNGGVLLDGVSVVPITEVAALSP